MATQLRLVILKITMNNPLPVRPWNVTCMLVIAVTITVGSIGKLSWAQNFHVPDGYASERKYEKTDSGEIVTVLEVRPIEGNFTHLSAMSLRPVLRPITDPTLWLHNRMRLVIDGNKLLEEIFDDPDSPFAGDELTEMRNLLERSLNELSKLAEWPLKYCNPITEGDSLGGAYFQLSCHYSIGAVTQYLLLRLHHANGAWYQTTVRTMNERRLRHFIAISNSFHID